MPRLAAWRANDARHQPLRFEQFFPLPTLSADLPLALVFCHTRFRFVNCILPRGEPNTSQRGLRNEHRRSTAAATRGLASSRRWQRGCGVVLEKRTNLHAAFQNGAGAVVGENSMSLEQSWIGAAVAAGLRAGLSTRCRHATLHGADIDAEAVKWLQSSLPNVIVRRNEGLPPLPFGAEKFDLV